MTITWKKVSSNESPAEVDETSSATSVYLRKNIEEKHITDEQGNESIMFEYDEAVLTKDEYARYQDKLDTEALIAEVLETIFAE